MAEILLSLTIIGVVAAITLPSLTGNINERTWNTQRKALYARMSQAIALMPALNGYGTLTEDENHSVTADTTAEAFVTEGLSKVLKINNICDSEHLEDCGIPSKITALNGNMIESVPKTLLAYQSFFSGTWTWQEQTSNPIVGTLNQIDTQAVAFETANGEAILTYYRPNCITGIGETADHQAQPRMCVNFIYDLNGSKGPNTMGKDIGFMTVFHPSDAVVVAPNPLVRKAGKAAYEDAIVLCAKQDSESRLPNADEALSMAINDKLMGGFTGNGHYLTASRIGLSVWAQSFFTGMRFKASKTYEADVWCVKR